MTNLLNVLKTMETETTGVKNDVINYLLEYNNNSEDLQTHLEDINNYGCESGQVNHLIYYTDTVAYFEEHESEIDEFVSDVYDLDIYGGSESIDQLADMFQVDNFETRLDEYYYQAHETIKDQYMHEYETIEELEEDLDELIFEERYNLATTLEDQDKNYLAWAIFEYEASVLFDELDEMELIK